VSGVFQTYLVWDAILKENSWELWATILLGLAMVATRVVAGIIRKDVTDPRAVALRNVGWAVLVTQSLTMVRSHCLWQVIANPLQFVVPLTTNMLCTHYERSAHCQATVCLLSPLDVRNMVRSVLACRFLQGCNFSPLPLSDAALKRRQVLAYMTWRDFGWRLHSRLGVDFRKKGAEARRRLYSFQDIYVTLIKLDLMCAAAVRQTLPLPHLLLHSASGT